MAHKRTRGQWLKIMEQEWYYKDEDSADKMRTALFAVMDGFDMYTWTDLKEAFIEAATKDDQYKRYADFINDNEDPSQSAKPGIYFLVCSARLHIN